MHSKPAKAVRRFCLDCQGGSAAFIQKYRDASCSLFDLRLCALSDPFLKKRPCRAIRRHCLSCSGGRVESKVM